MMSSKNQCRHAQISDHSDEITTTRGSVATVVIAVLLVASSLPSAAAATKPQIRDPLGDANLVNDQGSGDGSVGDVQTGADVGAVSDLLDVTFSDDSKNLYVKLGTEAEPPAQTGIGFRVRVNPGAGGGLHCVLFEAFFPGYNNDLSRGVAHVRDVCAGGAPIEIKILGDTIIVPRRSHEALGKRATLKAPQAQSFFWSGSYPTGAAGPVIDTTRVGIDYVLDR